MDLDYNLEKACFSLQGNLNDILNNKVIKSYFLSELKANFLEKEILIPLQEKTKENLLKILDNLFKRFSLPLKYSNSINEIFSDYQLEKEKFKIFSKKAKDIRNNHCDLLDFNTFKKVVESTITQRMLYPLQLLSAYHLAFSQNCCNFSVPGSGKTSIVYGAYSYLKSLEEKDIKKVNRLLVIGPLSSFYPWENEYRNCFGKNPSVKRIHSGISISEKKNYFYSNSPKEITFISYQGVPSLKEEIKYFLKKNKVMVILDEAHKIKNIEGGIIANSVLELSNLCKSRVVLTGTPLPQGYQDLLNLYKFIWPDKEIIDFNEYQLKEITEKPDNLRIGQLIDSISPFFLRIKKSDLNLPPINKNEIIYINMGSIQKKIYRFIENKFFNKFLKGKDDLFKIKLEKAKLIRLMQTATNPSLLKKPLDEYYLEGALDFKISENPEIQLLIKNYEKSEVLEKFKKIEELVRKKIEKGEKVVIWTVFIQNIFDLHTYLKSKGIKSKFIYGKTPLEKDFEISEIETREKIIQEFHKKDSFEVLIANPFAVSESISLHKACNNAIYLERTFNAAHFIQSKDRIYRYGMEQSPNYYYLLSKNSIDEVIEKRLIEKERRMNRIIEFEEIPLFFNATDSSFADKDIVEAINEYVKRNKQM